MSDITTIKTRAAELAGLGDALTAEQTEELRSLTEQIEAANAKAELVARSIKAAEAAPVAAAPAAEVEAARTVGEAFTRAAEFGSTGRSQVVEIATRTVASADLTINPDIHMVSAPVAPTNLTSAVSNVPVAGNSVTIVTHTPVYGAAVVAEGDLKPATTINWDTQSAALEVVANYEDVTRQALADEPQVQAIVNGALLSGLARKIEADVATAITSNADIQTVTGSSLLAAIRYGAAAVETAGYTASVVAVNPADLAALDLEVVGNFRNVQRGTQFWGVNAITSPLIPVGEAFIGDFATAVTLFSKGGVDVYTTDSDGDKFRKNIVTILAETRVKAAVTRPDAIRKVTVA